MNDLISREAALDAVETKIKKWNAVDGEGCHVGLGLRYTDVTNMLTELPSAQPERIRGRWKPFDLTWGRSIYACSVCGQGVDVPTVMGTPIYRYCPHCGADLRESR